jgi:hypothetical protein
VAFLLDPDGYWVEYGPPSPYVMDGFTDVWGATGSSKMRRLRRGFSGDLWYQSWIVTRLWDAGEGWLIGFKM